MPASKGVYLQVIELRCVLLHFGQYLWSALSNSWLQLFALALATFLGATRKITFQNVGHSEHL